MNTDHDKTTGGSIERLTIDSPQPGDIKTFPMGPAILTCTGNASGAIEATSVHGTIYDLSTTTNIPTSHPSGPNVGVVTPGMGGDWTLNLEAIPSSAGNWNLLAVWFEYNGTTPDSLMTVSFLAKQ